MPVGRRTVTCRLPPSGHLPTRQPAHWGEHIFEKRTQNQNLTIIFDSQYYRMWRHMPVGRRTVTCRLPPSGHLPTRQPALWEEHIFETRTQNENLTIIFDFQCPKYVSVADHL